MLLTIHDDKAPIRIDDGGAVRVGQTRVTLFVMLSCYNQGATAEQLVRSFPTLRLVDVYGVLNYYLRYQAEIDGWMRDCEREADELQRQIESLAGYADWKSDLRTRMDAVRAARVSTVG